MGDMLLNIMPNKKWYVHLCQVAHGPVLAGPMPSSCTKKNDTFLGTWSQKTKHGFLLRNPDQKSRISRIYKNQLMVCYGSAAANRLFYAMKRLWSSMVRCPEAKLSFSRLSKNPQDRSRLVVWSQPLGVVRWRLQNLQKLQIVGSRASTTHSLHWRRRLATKMLRYIKEDTKTLRGARLTPWAEIFPAPKGMKVRQVSADQIWPAESPDWQQTAPCQVLDQGVGPKLQNCHQSLRLSQAF